MIALDFFVPVGPHDGERAALLVDSWCNHVAIPGYLYLVYHPSVETAVLQLRSQHGHSIRPVNEYALARHLWSMSEWNSLWGWNRQQFLKLLSHTIVRTEWYCVCDATTLFIRPLTVADLTDNDHFVLSTVDSRSNDFLWFDEPAMHVTNEVLARDVCRNSYIAEFAVWNKDVLRHFWKTIRVKHTVRGFLELLNQLPRRTISEWCIYGSYCQHILGASLYRYKVEDNRIAFDRNYMSVENLAHPFYQADYDFPSKYKIVSLQRRREPGYILSAPQQDLVRHYISPRVST